jgi:AcrR family transcriptional regulator
MSGGLTRAAHQLTQQEGPRRRRRRTPEVAEREIIDAAEALLRERPFRELTVDEVMRRTDLSRPSFYVYFRDRHDLVLRVVEHLGGELFTMSERWVAAPASRSPRPRRARGHHRGVRQHGQVMQRRPMRPPTTGRRGGFSAIQGFIDVARPHRVRIERPDPAAQSRDDGDRLVWMTERYLLFRWAPIRPPRTSCSTRCGRSGRARCTASFLVDCAVQPQADRDRSANDQRDAGHLERGSESRARSVATSRRRRHHAAHPAVRRPAPTAQHAQPIAPSRA